MRELLVQCLNGVCAAGELPKSQLQLPNVFVESLPTIRDCGVPSKRLFVGGLRSLQEFVDFPLPLFELVVEHFDAGFVFLDCLLQSLRLTLCAFGLIEFLRQR